MIIWWDLVEKYESELETFNKKKSKQDQTESDQTTQNEGKTKNKRVKKVSKASKLIFLE